jgi:hypothetical protein
MSFDERLWRERVRHATSTSELKALLLELPPPTAEQLAQLRDEEAALDRFQRRYEKLKITSNLTSAMAEAIMRGDYDER